MRLCFIRASATRDSITELIRSDRAAPLHGHWINLVTIPCNWTWASKKQLRYSTCWENKKIGPFHSRCESHHSRKAHSGRCLCLYSPAVVSHPQILMRFLRLCLKGRHGPSNSHTLKDSPSAAVQVNLRNWKGELSWLIMQCLVTNSCSLWTCSKHQHISQEPEGEFEPEWGCCSSRSGTSSPTLAC